MSSAEIGGERHGVVREVVLLPHDNPMTLGGTNCYVIGAGAESAVVVVDPGTDDLVRLLEVIGSRSIALILLTHHHGDHSMGADLLHERSAAPVRAWRADLCRDGSPIRDGEAIDAAGVLLTAIHTPGHTSDSLCFSLPHDGEFGSVLTGDTILGRGTTIIEHPDGRLSDYLESMEKLRALGRAVVLPGHGPERAGIAALAGENRTRRLARLSEMRQLIATESQFLSVSEMTTAVYPDKTHPRTRRAAERTILAQLHFLGDPRGDAPATRLEWASRRASRPDHILSKYE